MLLLSNHPAVRAKVEAWSHKKGFTLKQTLDRDAAWAFLVEFPHAIVFWDLDAQAATPALGALIATTAQISRVFALGSLPIYQYPVLFQNSCFTHFLALEKFQLDHPLIEHVMENNIGGSHSGLLSYFPDGTRVQSIELHASGEKAAAVDAVQSFLGKLGVSERVALLAAQGADELLMNAIFDAPINSEGKRFRKGLERHSQFVLDSGERIVLQIAATEEYVGMSVSDSYGSFARETLLRFLSKNYSSGEYTVWKNDPGAGLGLYNLVHSGMSLVFFSEPRVRTDACLFFVNCTRFKDFREGFQFISVLLP